MNKVRRYGRILKETLKRWFDRDPFRSSTVIAYYSLFSLPGLLMVLITAVGYFYGTEKVTDKIITQIQGVVGTKVASDVRAIAAEAASLEGNTLAYIVGIAAILFGATGVFYHIQQSLNVIWEVKPKPKQRFLKLLRDRLFSFGIVLAIGFLLLISFAVSTMIAALSEWVTNTVSQSLSVLFHAIDILLSLGIITILFAAIYKFLPDVKIGWRHVWGGAIITSLLFVVAKFALGLYFGLNDPGSAYGAAGSIILILLWSSYSGMILLFGAEFTHVHAIQTSEVIEISDFAVPMHEETELTYRYVDGDPENQPQ
ncbi:MAG: YihY/virulence factor BrkB family protein [Cyclobacteriaceae bacterium]|jgi:membrane protein|nr:YihY/virulence factor BrkB family protein [Cyclobacteriaceae bacterium]